MGVLLLCACATGPLFEAPQPAPADQAQLYLYRPAQLIGGGMSHRVTIDGAAESLSLPNASWRRALLSPGLHTIAISDYLSLMHCNSLRLDLQAGQTIYVENAVRVVAYVPPVTQTACRAMVKPQREALEELVRLRLAE